MGLPSQAYRHQLTLAGKPLRVRYYTETIGSVWDDDRSTVQSGNDLYISGIILSMNNNVSSSSEKVLMEQGRLAYSDTKFVIAGSIDSTSGAKNFTVSMSGLNEVYKNIIPGIMKPEYFGELNYQIIYGRLLTPGSLF